jgi:hypothetical protein
MSCCPAALCLLHSVLLQILCMHGGLSPDLKNLDDIKRVARPTDVPDSGLLCDLLWADPDKDIQVGCTGQQDGCLVCVQAVHWGLLLSAVKRCSDQATVIMQLQPCTHRQGAVWSATRSASCGTLHGC